MEKVSIVGMDLAKKVFQVHAVGETGDVVLRRSLRRRQVMAISASSIPV
jgi:transposase